MRLSLALSLVLACCSNASATFMEVQLNAISITGNTRRGTIEIDNGVLQPFNITFAQSELSYSTTPSYTVFSNPITFSLDTATPLVDLTPSSFQLSNLSGRWIANITTNGFKDTVFDDYDLPLEILNVSASDTHFLLTSRAEMNAPIADTIIQGNPFVIESGLQSISTATAVPEPGQYLMFGLLCIGLFTWKKIKSVRPSRP